jgi:propanol-preferring alcohol dehydrogenase
VIAVDTKPAALEHATSQGAHHAVAAGDDTAATITELAKGRGVDASFDLVGSEATLSLALGTARAGSRVTLMGAAGGTVPYSLWATKFEVELTTSMWGSISDLRDVIALAAAGHIVPKVTTFDFDHIPDAFHALEAGTLEGRAVIVP